MARPPFPPFRIQIQMTLLSLPVEILSDVLVHLPPRQIHSLQRLCKTFDFAHFKSFSFCHSNISVLRLQQFSFHSRHWHKLGIEYIAALIASFGFSYHSLSLLGISYDENSQFDLDASPCAALIPQAITLAAHYDTLYLYRINARIQWSTCDALVVQVAAISGWTQVWRSITTACPLIARQYSNLAFDLAAQNGHLAFVQDLLESEESGLDIGFENSSAFRYACANGHLDIVQAIAAYHFSRAAGERRLNPSACDNFALIQAAQHGHAHVVEFLLQSFLEIDPMSFDGVLLRRAIEFRRVEVLQVLLRDARVDWKVLEKPYRDAVEAFLRLLGCESERKHCVSIEAVPATSVIVG
ncbi:hypothetical protein HDU98_007204 [Podochytrium sp. JEL0797]|nr:hypothetical protein HDU98_007204 [Podochytrium sp. JEL0797]